MYRLVYQVRPEVILGVFGSEATFRARNPGANDELLQACADPREYRKFATYYSSGHQFLRSNHYQAAFREEEIGFQTVHEGITNYHAWHPKEEKREGVPRIGRVYYLKYGDFQPKRVGAPVVWPVQTACQPVTVTLQFPMQTR